MFLIKVIFGCFCVYFCVITAKNKGKSYKEEYLFWDSVCISCDALISDLSYAKRAVSKSLNVDYSSKIYANVVLDFISGNRLSFPSFISNEEEIKLNAFFDCIGKSDASTQKNAILSYKNDFYKSYIQSKQKYDKNYSAILKVGFSLGVMLFILVI